MNKGIIIIYKIYFIPNFEINKAFNYTYSICI